MTRRLVVAYRFCAAALCLLAACAAPQSEAERSLGSVNVEAEVSHTPTAAPTQTKSPPSAPATPTPRPTRTGTPTLPASATANSAPTASPTATLVACSERMPRDEDLLTLVTRDFGLSRAYAPGDLVPLSDYFSNSVTLGYPTEVSAAIIEPLQAIVQAMQEEGLAPQIVSGYRSYAAQSLALQKWLDRYPDWANNLSAPPGHSEHQLGTTVDFGSPELEPMLGDDYVQFHPAFSQTSEGKWVALHAPEFGFTMSYPEDAFERTSFYYEPWHFRYVGRGLAQTLAARNLTISEYLRLEQSVPCLVE